MPDLARIVLFAVAASLAACGPRSGPPAPVSLGGESRPALSRAEAASGVVVVQPGDTLYAVARRTGTPVRALIDTNRLQAPYRIQAGQRLQIPTIAAARPAGPAPSAGAPATSAPAAPPPVVASVPRGSVESAPIAAPPPTSTATSAAPSAATAATTVPPLVMPPPPAPGSESVPPVAPSASPRTPAPAVATSTPSLPPSAPSPVGPAPSSSPAAPSTGAEAPTPQASAAVTPPPPAVEAQPAARAGRFLWPVRGNIVSTFGQKPGGLQNDGINIAAPRGTPVRATENGVVVYAGNELKGFGNLLLLRHADGWMSAYAHLDDILVQRGASVSRGQVVAKVGQSGSVASPQLHFELRRGGRAVDPRGQLAPVQTAAN